MALFDDVKAEIADMSTKVDTITAKIADLEAQLAAGGMTADEEASIKADLDALRDKLTTAAGS